MIPNWVEADKYNGSFAVGVGWRWACHINDSSLVCHCVHLSGSTTLTKDVEQLCGGIAWRPQTLNFCWMEVFLAVLDWVTLIIDVNWAETEVARAFLILNQR